MTEHKSYFKSGSEDTKPKRKRVNNKSFRQKQVDAEYTNIRAIWLQGTCEAAGLIDGCTGQATEVQHVKARSVARSWQLHIDNWAGMCGSCHRYVTLNQAEGRNLGLVALSTDPITKITTTKPCGQCGEIVYWATTEDNVSVPLICDQKTLEPKPFSNGSNAFLQQAWIEHGLINPDDRTQPVRIYVRPVTGHIADPDLPLWRRHTH